MMERERYNFGMEDDIVDFLLFEREINVENASTRVQHNL